MSKTLIAVFIFLVAVSSATYFGGRARKSVAVTAMTPETAVSVTEPIEKAKTPEKISKKVEGASNVSKTQATSEKHSNVQRDLPTPIAETEVQAAESAPRDVTPVEIASPTLEESVPAPTGPTGDVEAKLTVAQLTGLDNSRAVTEFLLGLRYEIDENNAFGIIQEARKLYEIEAQGESEFLLQDTAIYYQCRLGKGLLDTNWALNAGVTIPVSRESRDNMLVTRPSLGFEISRRFLNDRVRVAIQPFFHYHFNQYATSLGRVPLKKMSPGAQAEVDVQIIPGQMNFVVWGKGYYNVFEEFDDSATTPAPTSSLEYGSYIGLGLNRHLGAQVGYVKGNSIFKDPILDGTSSFYDPAASRVYAAVEFKF